MHRCLAPALLLAFTSVIFADELRGKVVSIADGDTITVLDADKKQHKVRLTWMDLASLIIQSHRAGQGRGLATKP